MKWISVKDRLLELGKDVLVLTSEGRIGIFNPTSIGHNAEGVYCFFTHQEPDSWNQVVRHITHWMPLPEPQKEEE